MSESIKVFICLFFFWFFATPVHANILINEFSPTTENDWVELYNNSVESVDLANYKIRDNSSSGNIRKINCSIAPHGFLTILWGNDLNNAGDVISLLNDTNLEDCVSYGDGNNDYCAGSSSVTIPIFAAGKFGARATDGASTWEVRSSNTQNSPNDGSPKDESAVCTTPLPSPSASPSVSPSPSPSPSVSPSPSPSPSRTPLPSPSKRPSPTPPALRSPSPTPLTSPELLSSPDGTVAGEATEINLTGFGVSPSPSPKSSPVASESPSLTLNKARAKTVLYVGLGFILTGSGGYFGYRKYRTMKAK